MKRPRTTFRVVARVPMVLALLCGSGAAYGSLSQSVISSPGGFVQAGAYLTSCGCGMVLGLDLEAHIGTPADFEEMAFSGNSTASASAAGSSGQTTNSASATVGLGYFRPVASNTSPNNAFFAIGIAHGGWKDTFTVSHPGLNGQNGFMLFRIRAAGQFHTSGFTGAANVSTTGYKDGIELLVNAHFAPGEAAVGSDRQRAQWGTTSMEADPNRTVNGSVTMSVPITFGQSFTLGIYAFAAAGQRSSASIGGVGHGDLDFSGGGIEWGGVVSVLQQSGAAVSDYTIVSGSGIDWVPPVGESGCAADFNGDSFLNPDDLSDYITCFFLQVQFPGTCADADFNEDGFVNPDDLSDFVTGFFIGC
jgi:hypothetical protein